MLTKLETISNGRASLVKSVNRIAPLAGSPNLFRYLALIKLTNGNFISGSGFSLNKESAKIAAICESIERYCANHYDKNLIICSSYKELNSLQTLNPDCITRFEKWQYEQMESYEHFNKDTPISWVYARDIRTKKEILVPFELIYLTSPPFNKPMRDIISTGLACGDNYDNAVISGLSECIERDAFICFWMLKQVNYQIDLDTVNDAYTNELISRGKRANLEIFSYNITQEFNIPTVLTLIKPKYKKGFYLGCATALDYSIALRKSIEEGLGGYSIYQEIINHFNKKVPSSIDEIITLDDHPLYYIAGNNDGVLKEILPDNIPKKGFLNYQISLEEAVANLVHCGHNIYAKDITTRDVKKLNLNVVRVTIPTLCFLPINTPMLNCKRLKEKKEILQQNYNLLPHPFP